LWVRGPNHRPIGPSRRAPQGIPGAEGGEVGPAHGDPGSPFSCLDQEGESREKVRWLKPCPRPPVPLPANHPPASRGSNVRPLSLFHHLFCSPKPSDASVWVHASFFSRFTPPFYFLGEINFFQFCNSNYNLHMHCEMYYLKTPTLHLYVLHRSIPPQPRHCTQTQDSHWRFLIRSRNCLGVRASKSELNHGYRKKCWFFVCIRRSCFHPPRVPGRQNPSARQPPS